MKNYFLLLFLFFSALIARGQFQNGQPASFRSTSLMDIRTVKINERFVPTPKHSAEPTAFRAGYTIRLTDSITGQGRWETNENGLFIWRLALHIAHAEGLNIYCKDFFLKKNEKLFIYNADRSEVNGAFTERNNGNYLVTDFIPDNEIIIEFNTPEKNPALPFLLSELGVSTNKPKGGRDFGDSQFCEVPVNCPEGDDWQNEKGGVSRILVKAGSNLWWCTGSLLNNTRNDKTPYFLTANHCGQSADKTDYEAWKFYFNFESPDCEKPLDKPESISLTGSKLLATSPNNTGTGSDFKLLLLDEIPEYFHPWYNGWDRSGDVSPSGSCIHHPEGDIKMISTYDQPIVSTRYNVPSPDENGFYWKVNWTETSSGYGVTEPGSSGSPLFNSSGNIIGNLTGGQASCNFPQEPDYYGKFSYSWESNGSDSAWQLKYWLDPDNTGVMTLHGSNFNASDFYADFDADNKNIKLGETIHFTNWSEGDIDNYEWVFSNGEPSSFNGKNPPPVKYSTAGSFDVKLKISNGDHTDTKLKKAYIHVTPLIFPNPTKGKLIVSFGKEGVDIEKLQLFAFDITGREVSFFAQLVNNQSAVLIDLSTHSRGMYFLRIVNDNRTQLIKVIVSE